MSITWEALTLVILLIAALGLMFRLVFQWMQRAEQSSYLGTVYQASVLQLEKSRLCQPVEQKRSQRKYEKDAISEKPWTKEPPKISWQLEQLIEEHRKASDVTRRPGSGSGIGGLGGSWTALPGLELETDKPELPYLPIKLTDAGAQQLVDGYNQKVEEYNKGFGEWKSAIKQAEELAYRKCMATATDKAKDLATKAADVDVAVFRGRGPAFVLEFTAIVVIIFAAVILGILGTLDGQQIGTLLAAIAGYVLGKATSGGKGELEKVAPVAPPAPPPAAPPPAPPPAAAPPVPSAASSGVLPGAQAAGTKPEAKLQQQPV